MNKVHEFVIDGKLPSLNSYTQANRYNKYAGSKMKANNQSYIRGCIYQQLERKTIQKPVIVHCTWVEDNRKRDLDNIRFAVKFILDALVECKILENDSCRYVKGFTDDFKYEDKAKVIVQLEEVEEGDTNEY